MDQLINHYGYDAAAAWSAIAGWTVIAAWNPSQITQDARDGYDKMLRELIDNSRDPERVRRAIKDAYSIHRLTFALADMIGPPA